MTDVLSLALDQFSDFFNQFKIIVTFEFAERQASSPQFIFPQIQYFIHMLVSLL